LDNPKTLGEYNAIRKKLKAVNDVVSFLEGTDDLNFKRGRNRFLNVIAAHEKFESEHIKDGKTIDDISADDLEKFVKENPEAAYTVLTEPKLGEDHKETTRLFYMAEQALKIMTQVCERLLKKSISKSSGMSIVMSSDLGVAISLIENASITGIVAIDPMTTIIRDTILARLRVSVNIKQKILKEIINEVPVVV